MTCPVVILHGVQDESVPYKANTDIIHGSKIKASLLQNSIEIMNKLKTDNVELVFSKQADHHFSDPNSFLILSSALRKMMSK